MLALTGNSNANRVRIDAHRFVGSVIVKVSFIGKSFTIDATRRVKGRSRFRLRPNAVVRRLTGSPTSAEETAMPKYALTALVLSMTLPSLAAAQSAQSITPDAVRLAYFSLQRA